MIELKSGESNNIPSDVNFTWYFLGNYLDLISSEYPQYSLDLTVLQLEVVITRVLDIQENEIDGVSCLNIGFNGAWLPLGQDGYYPYCKKYSGSYYAVTLYNGGVYLGVES
jgi:hypothetical protein